MPVKVNGCRLQVTILMFISLVFNEVKCEDFPIVQTQQGQVEGRAEISTKGRTFYSFRGIPYAQPPIGNLRFKAPISAEPWAEVFIADNDGPVCIQYDALTFHAAFGLEDCLHLNVYTPSLPAGINTTLLPVMIFFYGGGYAEGADTFVQYGPHRFMDYDMLLVSVNYRLGAFGFLSTADSVLPGNQGLLDQLLTLQWVHDNIAAFGGNPNGVTIQGQSAGAASVGFHMLSPASRGLFHQTIAESGSPLGPWTLQLDPVYWAYKLADAFLCPKDDSESLLDCLQQVPAFNIVEMTSSFNNKTFLALPYLPVVEDPAYGQFLTVTPMTALESGNFSQVPTMIGVVRDEGSFFYGDSASYFEVIDDHFFMEILPAILQNLTHFKYNYVNMSYAIKDQYFTDIDLTNSSQVIRAATDMYSDMMMFSIVDMTIRIFTNWSIPVYSYLYDYCGDMFLTNFTGQPEVAHTIELLFLFNASFVILSERDSKVSENLVQMWSNFVTTGDPNPTGTGQWIPTPIGTSSYLDIQENLVVMEDSFLPQRMWFWNDYLPTIGGSQYD